MIDLPDYGYTSFSLRPNDPGGVVPGSLGGPDDRIPRPGYRYGIQFTTPLLDPVLAQQFQSLLEQGSRDDVSYPWPLDYAVSEPGAPLVSASSPAGSVIPIKGLVPGYSFDAGHVLAVISGGVGYVHKVTTAIDADGSGNVTVSVFPWTRVTFANNDVIEIRRPRIRGNLLWEGAGQGAIGKRPFTFTIAERI